MIHARPLFASVLLVAAFHAHVAIGQSVSVDSPDKNVSVDLNLVNGSPQWSIRFNQQPIVTDGAIQLYLGDQPDQPLTFDSAVATTSEHDSTWQPTWGQFSEVRNHYREVVWTLKPKAIDDASVTVTLRVFNDGVAIRYTPGVKHKPFSDRTGFSFADDFTFWSANGEHPNHGPIKLSQWKHGAIQMPMTIQAGPNVFCAVLEAAIYDQYPFSVHRAGGATRFETRSKPAKFTSDESNGGSAWRVITLGRSAGDLITNQIAGNLNPPLTLADASWIRPGLALWDWRAWGATAPDGFQYGLDMSSWKRFIDFAARKDNVRYLLLDANWYGPEFDPKEDPTTSRDHLVQQIEGGKVVRKPAPDDWAEPIDVPALIQYANERGVGIVLYINDHARKNFDFEETLATYEKWGAAGIKFGFMATRGNAKVRDTRKIIKLCAKHKLVCDFHDGPIPGSGDTRTYPNYLTREFCHAQADGKRSFSPETFCTSMFVNMLTGSLDMSNGLYAIKDAEKVRPRIFTKVNTTVVGETARNLICFSAMATIPDIPEAYDAKSDLFSFIEAMPMTWDETRVLNSQIGDHITTARRTGETWLIGSACDENGATLPIDLSFLDEGKTYQATVFEDSADTHFETNPEAYKIHTESVKKGDVIEAVLAPGGGHCVMLK